jgi:uncharacterized protein (TIGR03382 family)
MMPRSTRLAAAFLLPAMFLGSRTARAQSIAPTSQVYPTRVVNGVDTMQPSTRALNLNPYGVNYLDCIGDQTLRFNLLASGLNGGQLIEVWAGSGDCTPDTSRGIQSVPSCWLVRPAIAGIVAGTGSSVPITIDVRVQDLVGHQTNIPQTMTYVPVGAEACQTQTVDTAQNFTVFFMPTDSSGRAIANSGLYKYAIISDLVGPPAPSGAAISNGDTLFTVTWTPNIDADTAGYDVYVDPIPGQEGAGVGAEPVLVCPDTGSATASGDATLEATVDASDEAMAEATIEASVDAGDDGSASDAMTADAVDDTAAPISSPVCTYQITSGSGDGGVCMSRVLGGNSSTLIDAAAAVAQVDEAGNLIEGGTTSGVVGISNIPSNYVVGMGPSGVTVSDKNTGSYQVTGLRDGQQYTVVVAAVDGSGNIGPPSDLKCATPAPINDFWDLYRQAGGHAGGGFCALEAVGKPAPAAACFALVAGASLLVRRRRRTRR